MAARVERAVFEGGLRISGSLKPVNLTVHRHLPLPPKFAVTYPRRNCPHAASPRKNEPAAFGTRPLDCREAAWKMKKLRRLIIATVVLLVLLGLAILIFPSVGGYPLHRYMARLRAK